MDRRTFLGAGLVSTVMVGAAHAADATDPALASLIDAADFSGAVLVKRGGTPLHRAGRGQASIERSLPNTADTRFKIGSISKTFTAGAVLALRESGALDLDDPVSRHIDDAPPAWADIRVRNLLNHSSGLRDTVRIPGGMERMARQNTLAGTVDLLRPLPLEFAPGSRVQYGNSGSVVAARIVERTTGQLFPEALRTLVLQPTGLLNSGYADTHAAIPGLADGYRPTEQGLAPAAFIDMSVALGAGADYSTVDDLDRWIVTLERGDLAAAARDAGMFTPGPGPIGLAWTIGDLDGRRMVSHAGGINGFSAYMARFPDQELTVVVLGNRERIPADALSHALARRVLA